MTVTQAEAAGKLEDFMMELSQDCYCAMWLVDLEFYLWDTLQGKPDRYSFRPLTDGEIDRLRALSTSAGGWITWPHKGHMGFVSFEEWAPIYAKYLEENK